MVDLVEVVEFLKKANQEPVRGKNDKKRKVEG